MGLNFGQAVEQMKNGRRVKRASWGDADVWCVYFPPVKLSEDKVSERMRRFLPKGDVQVNGYFIIYLGHQHGGVWQPGWVPTQDDLQMDDWLVLDDAGPTVHRPAPPKLVLAR